MGVFSPRGRDADILVAGNAFGTIFTAERFRGLEMKTDVMDTVNKLLLSVFTMEAGLVRESFFLWVCVFPRFATVSAHAHGNQRVRGRARGLHRFWSLR